MFASLFNDKSGSWFVQIVNQFSLCQVIRYFACDSESKARSLFEACKRMSCDEYLEMFNSNAHVKESIVGVRA
jgi:hypothetical protein